jgi:hypothetical protein
MRKEYFLFLTLLVCGCLQAAVTVYRCSDGTMVDDQSKCSPPSIRAILPGGTQVPYDDSSLPAEFRDCNGIEKWFDKIDCYTNASRKMKDPASCDTIDNRTFNGQVLRKQCLIGLAESLKDPALCGRINYQLWSDKGICYSGVSLALRDPLFCDKIDEGEYSDTVKDNCYEQVAIRLNDSSLCARIIGGTKETKYPKISKKIKGLCYGTIAGQLKNDSICENALDGSADECYLFIGECDKIQETQLLQQCALDSASRGKNISLCDNSPIKLDKPIKERCYFNVAIGTNNTNLCERLEGQTIKDTCYDWLSTRRNDTSLCERISSDSIRGSCLSGASVPLLDVPFSLNLTVSISVGNKTLVSENLGAAKLSLN